MARITCNQCGQYQQQHPIQRDRCVICVARHYDDAAPYIEPRKRKFLVRYTKPEKFDTSWGYLRHTEAFRAKRIVYAHDTAEAAVKITGPYGRETGYIIRSVVEMPES